MKAFVRGFAPAVKALDWFDIVWLVYILGAGVLFGLVMEILMDEFRP